VTLTDNYFTNVPKPHNVTASELDQMVNGINANATSISTTHNHNGSNSQKVTMPQVYWMTLHLVAGTAHRAAFLNSFMTPSAAKISIYAKPAVNLTTVNTVVTAQTTTATGTIAAHSLTINNASLSAVANTLPEIAVPAVGGHTHAAGHAHDFKIAGPGVSGSIMNFHSVNGIQDTVQAATVSGGGATGVQTAAITTSSDGGHGHTIASGTGSHGHTIADHNHVISGTQAHSFVGDVHTHTMDTHNHTVTKTLGSSIPTDVTAKVDANTIFTSRNFSSSGDYLNQTIDYTWFAVGDHFVEITANIDCEVQVCINVKGTIS
jgi:hypothetical protein